MLTQPLLECFLMGDQALTQPLELLPVEPAAAAEDADLGAAVVAVEESHSVQPVGSGAKLGIS